MKNLSNELPRLKVAGTEEEMVPGPQLVESLRHSGYSYWTAIDELVDNSEDAGAKNVNIDFYCKGEMVDKDHSKKDVDLIVIADDGNGMNKEELRKCHQLGSVRKYAKQDIGKFGLGGILGSIAIARKVMVVTKQYGTIIGRLTDLDNIESKGKLVSTHYEENQLPDYYLNMFKEHVPDEQESGTCIFLEQLDKMSTTRYGNIRTKLMAHLGQQYFSFLARQTLTITVNGARVDDQHPIRWDDAPPDARVHEDTFAWTDPSGQTHKFTLQIVDLTSMNVPTKTGQGGYFVRNGRLLCGGVTNNDSYGVSGFWNDHADSRYVRWMIQFSSDSDEVMGVGFQKKSIQWHKSLNDKIASIVKPHHARIAAETGKRRKNGVLKSVNDQILEDIKRKLNKTKNGVWDIHVHDLGRYGESTENHGTDIRLNEEHALVKELLNASSKFSKESGFKILVAVEKSFAEIAATSEECDETLKRLHELISTNLAAMIH